MDIHRLAEKSAQEFAHKCAVLYEDGGNMSSYSYQELWKTVEEISRYFSSLKMNGKTAALILNQNLHLPAILLGLLSCKCPFYPVAATGERFIIDSIRNVGASWIIQDSCFENVNSSIVEQLHGHNIHSCVLEKFNMQLIQLDVHSEDRKDCDEDIAYCITTSGTTGSPKVIRVPHSCIVPNLIDLRNIFKISKEDKVLLTAPLTFDLSIIDIFLALTSGALLVIVPESTKNNPDNFINIIHTKHKATVIQATPSLIRQCSPQNLRETIFGQNSSLRILALGGEQFPSVSELKKWVHPENKTNFYNLYGITEVSCWASCDPVDVHHLIKTNGIVSLGLPLSKTLIRVDVETEPSEKCLQQGYIWIGSSERICIVDSAKPNSVPFEDKKDETVRVKPQDRRGLWSKPETDGGKEVVWRNTGDLGQVLDDGRIVFLGRLDDQFKRHGKRLTLSALEAVCCELPWISKCCAVMENSSNQLVVFFINERMGDNNVWEKSSNQDLIAVNGHQENVLGKTVNAAVSPSNKGDTEESGASDDNRPSLEMKMWGLRRHVQDALPSHYIPDRIVEVETFPLTPHGKLDRKKLLDIERTDDRVLEIACESPITWITQLWKTFLPKNVECIGMEDTFLASGGDSLAAISLVNHLERLLGSPAQQFLSILLNKNFLCFVESLSSFIKKHNNELRLKKSCVVGVGDEEKRDGKDATGLEKELRKVSPSLVKQYHRRKDINSKSLDKDIVSYENNFVSVVSPDAASRMSDVNKNCHVGALEDRTDLCILHVISRGNKKSKTHIESKKYTQLLKKCSCNYTKAKSDNTQLSYGLNKEDSSTENEERDGVNVCSQSSNSSSAMNLTLTERRKRKENQVSSDLDPPSKKFFSSNPPCLECRWKVDTSKCVDASPVIAAFSPMQAIVFIGSHSGCFKAVDIHTGRILWTAKLPDRIESSANVCVHEAYVVTGCYDGSIYFLNVALGVIEWKFPTGDSVKSSPCVDNRNGHVICGSHDGWLYALNGKAKMCEWKYHAGGGSVYSSPVVDAQLDRVYAASLNGKLIALNSSKGTPDWCTDLQKPLFSSPCLHAKSILIGSVDGSLYCVDNDCGKVMWTFKTQGPIFSSPVSQEGSIFIGSHDQMFYCLTSNGQLSWKFKTESQIFSTPFIFRSSLTEESYPFSSKEESQDKIASMSAVVFACTSGTLYVLDASSGRVSASTRLPGEVFSSPVVYEGKIVVGCRDDFVYCFDFSPPYNF